MIWLDLYNFEINPIFSHLTLRNNMCIQFMDRITPFNGIKIKFKYKLTQRINYAEIWTHDGNANFFPLYIRMGDEAAIFAQLYHVLFDLIFGSICAIIYRNRIKNKQKVQWWTVAFCSRNSNGFFRFPPSLDYIIVYVRKLILICIDQNIIFMINSMPNVV